MNILGVWTGTATCPPERARPMTITIVDQRASEITARLTDGSPLRGELTGDQIGLTAPWGQAWVGRITPSGRGLRMVGTTLWRTEPTGCNFELSRE
jgi:hypothetical protein